MCIYVLTCTDKILRYFTFYHDLLADVFRAVLGIVNRVI